MLTIILVVLVVLALTGSGWGYSRYGIGGGIGPIGLLVVVFAVLFLTGQLGSAGMH